LQVNLKDKVVIVTGGTAGIGAATAIEFAKEGCKVCVCGHTDKRLEEFRAQCRELGYEIDAFKCNIGDPAEEKAFIDAVAERYGRIDVLVNNAGTNRAAELTDVTDELWASLIDINLTSVWRITKFTVPYFKKQGGGVVINNTAFSGLIAQAESGPYAVAKSGEIALTKVFAAELAPFNIRVNGVAPGVIMTPLMRSHLSSADDLNYRLAQVPMNRPADPAEVGSVIVFLASDSASYITGEIIPITGGKYAVQDRRTPWQRHKPDELDNGAKFM